MAQRLLLVTMAQRRGHPGRLGRD
jgi:hypothetical protein